MNADKVPYFRNTDRVFFQQSQGSTAPTYTNGYICSCLVRDFVAHLFRIKDNKTSWSRPKMTATIIPFPPRLFQRTLDNSQNRLNETRVLTVQLRDMCSETLGLADSLADGLAIFSLGMDNCLAMLADGAALQKRVMTALESGDLMEMERCRDSMLPSAAASGQR